MREGGESVIGKFRLWLVLLCLVLESTYVGAAAHPSPIPMPLSAEWHDGAFQITGKTSVDGQGAAQATAAELADALGLKGDGGKSARIRLSIVPVIAGSEAYRLRVTPREIRIEASDPAGLFYGAQTLRQLVSKTSDGLVVPSVNIQDSPRFRWRGLLVDVSRHFFGKPTMFRIMDEMAAYKLNVLKLHLTDYPGWRVEIPGYPRLTEIGAEGDNTRPDSKVRQYFTTKDIEEIVAYAAERHIMVVPEIEMPGHAGSGARAYPEFFDPSGTFNPGKPETYEFVRGVLTQVARLFPAPYIHFGGDEVGDETWKDNPDVIRLKAEKGLKTTKDVEAYFGGKVVEIIKSLGKRPMAWDEQAEAGASKEVVIQWWRKGRPDVLNAAAKGGYEMIMSPVDYTYFDYHQAQGEPGAPWEGNDGGPISISRILSWEPVPTEFTPEQSARVIGVEAAVWTEFIRTERYLEFMTFPRLLAFAEVAWRPRGPRDEKEFYERLQPHSDALKAKGINVRQSEGDGYEFIVN
jgi:hexosaminidase